ncbi:MAG TPA: hypothetical protein VH370_04620 [Humisphaera sp.]|jgi:hypothetical protein|nr:hypothetical protein [Humisphaera sp.]
MNSRRIAAIAMLLLFAGSACADQRQLVARRKQEELDAFNKKPLLDKTRVEDVFTIRREDGDLVLHVHLPPSQYESEHRGEFAGFLFPALVECRGSRDTLIFAVTLSDWSDPSTLSRVELASTPGAFEIDKHVETADTEVAITFRQSTLSASLIVYQSGGGARGPILQITADSFNALRRHHLAAIETYLRPMLRDLHQEGALAPETPEAWQILADDLPIDPKYKQDIEKRLPALDDDKFKVRLQAADDLYKLGKDAALYIMHMDRGNLSFEQRMWLDEVIAHYRTMPQAQVRRLHDDPHFLADCLDCDDLQIRQLALARLRRLTGKPLAAFDPKVKPDKRAAAVNDAREELFRPSP